MARTDEGEYEFVVGNRHLLSAVFVLMVLFGIFFSLGYFVGRSGDGGPAPQQAAVPSGGTVRQPQAPPPAAAPESVGPGEAQVAQPPETASTQPAAETRAEETKPEPQAPAPEPEPASAPAAAGPQPGQTFLQVAAVKQSEAKVIVDILKAKGYQAMTAPVPVNGVPSDTLFRALVGPIRDAAELARLKSNLQAAGFKPHVTKY